MRSIADASPSMSGFFKEYDVSSSARVYGHWGGVGGRPAVNMPPCESGRHTPPPPSSPLTCESLRLANRSHTCFIPRALASLSSYALLVAPRLPSARCRGWPPLASRPRERGHDVRIPFCRAPPLLWNTGRGRVGYTFRWRRPCYPLPERFAT